MPDGFLETCNEESEVNLEKENEYFEDSRRETTSKSGKGDAYNRDSSFTEEYKDIDSSFLNTILCPKFLQNLGILFCE